MQQIVQTDSTCIVFVYNFAKALRSEQLVSTLPSNLINKAIELNNQVFRLKANLKSRINIDARLCYTRLQLIRSINYFPRRMY